MYEATRTAFGEALQGKGIEHRLITPYYPEGNGKAEALLELRLRIDN
jgi:transposase InsO family protein